MPNSNNKSAGADPIAFAGSYKFFPPLPLAGAIRRRGLISDITSSNQYSVVVIQGPAGHGKTTLMQQLYEQCREKGGLTGWVTLEETDDDISRFNACLRILAINATQEQTENVLIPDGPLSGSGAVENILRQLDSVQEPVALFLDEFQVLDEPVNIALLESVIERLPPNVTFYLGSRSIPNLARGRLLISGRVKWVKPEELCFTTQEVLEFLIHVGLEVSSLEAQAFREQTGGWPAILQLLHLALKGGKIDRNSLLIWVKGCQSQLMDYLADNVMLDQSAHRTKFLLRTSLLNRMSAPICEAVTGEKHAQQMLQDFVSQGLFIRAIDYEQRWFRYHSIFSDYLIEQLRATEPEQETKIYCIAAKWFSDQGYPEEAIRYAVKAQEYELAADVLNDWLPKLIRSARLQTADQLCSLLPDRVYSARPILCWGRAWCMLFLSQRISAHNSLSDLEQIATAKNVSTELSTSVQILKAVEGFMNDDSKIDWYWIDQIPLETGDMPKYRCFEMNALANIKAIYRLRIGDFDGAKEYALLGEALGVRGDSPFSGAYSISLMAYGMIQNGHLAQAIKRLKEGLNNKKLSIQGSFATASLSAIYGFALYELGNYIEAESHLRDSIEAIAKSLPLDWVIPAYLSLARASALAESESGESIEILDNAEKLGLISQQPRMVRAIRRERIRMALVKGNFKDARFVAQMSDVPGESTLADGLIHLAEGCDDDTICKARMDIYCGDPYAALEQLDAEIAHGNSTGWVRRRIKLLILKGLANKAINKNEQAEKVMFEALELAAPRDYVALFVDEGDQCLTLLSEILGASTVNPNNQVSEFISRVLQNAGCDIDFSPVSQTAKALTQQLTKRELDILQLVANGATNVEIADRLCVSYNTVKFHMKNLYGKLRAKNRVNLISTARELTLI